MTNTNPTTGVRFGVIACNSLDPDLVNDLFYGHQAINVSYDAAYAEAKAEAVAKWAEFHEQAQIEANETDPNMSEEDFETFIHKWFDSSGIFDEEDQFVDNELESFSDGCQIEEPTIEGELHGVEYSISWLGGAPIVFIFEGPIGNAYRLCSPCIPNAADLDGGFTLDSDVGFIDGLTQETHDSGHPCYCVPRDWLYVQSPQLELI